MILCIYIVLGISTHSITCLYLFVDVIASSMVDTFTVIIVMWKLDVATMSNFAIAIITFLLMN